MMRNTPMTDKHIADTRTGMLAATCPGVGAIENVMRMAEKALPDAGNGALTTRTGRMRRIAAMQRELANAMAAMTRSALPASK